jgi:DNA-binding beta-propeller fold protein YncE
LFSDELVPNAIFDVENVPVGQDIFAIPFPPGVLIIAFDETGQRVFTANFGCDSVSIIDLANSNTVTNVPLAPSGGIDPTGIAFDEAGQRVFTANDFSDSVSIIDLSSATVAKICQDSGFDTGDIRTFESNGQTIQQISCINFVGECSGDIEDGEIRECTVQDYVVNVNEIPEPITVSVDPTGALPCCGFTGNPPTTVHLASHNINPTDHNHCIFRKGWLVALFWRTRSRA